MRNIADYEKHYMEHPFERHIEKYRRNVVKKVIGDYASKDCSILEIGCGINPLFCDYEGQYFFTVIEPAEQCYQNAKSLAKRYDCVECFQGFLENMIEQFQTNKFDIIICSSLLHEVEDPGILLRAIRALCHKDTVVHINVPNALSIHRLLGKEMGLISDIHQLSDTNNVLQQQIVFDLEKLKQLVIQEKYQIEKEGSYFIKPFTHQQMQQCMEQRILHEGTLDALDQICKSCLQEFGAEIYLNMKMKNM